ncbi:MAG: condensation domain-containing protein [Cytophagales bacterium]|nr:condensation domain-containing protein [Cytophagales bacterium]
MESNITRRPDQSGYPLSHQQVRFTANYTPEMLNKHVLPYSRDFNHAIDPGLLNQAYQHLLATERYFRITLKFEKGQGEITIKDKANDEIQYVDFSTLGNQAESQSDIYCQENELPILLDRAPLCRMHLIKIASNRFRIFIVFHHFVSDTESCHLFLTKLSEVYRSLKQQKELNDHSDSIDYLDYILWQKSVPPEGRDGKQAAYWREKLSKSIIPELLIDSEDVSHVEDRRRKSLFVRLDSELSFQMADYCKKQGILPVTFFLGVYFLSLREWTGADDIPVITVYKGRQESPLLKSVLGLFINLVILKHRFDQDLTFVKFFRKVQKELMMVHKNQGYPHYLVGRNLAAHTDFAFNFLNERGFDDLDKQPMPRKEWEYDNKRGELFLFSLIVHLSHNIRLEFQYPPFKFEKDTITHMIRGVEETIRMVCTQDCDQEKEPMREVAV